MAPAHNTALSAATASGWTLRVGYDLVVYGAEYIQPIERLKRCSASAQGGAYAFASKRFRPRGQTRRVLVARTNRSGGEV